MIISALIIPELTGGEGQVSKREVKRSEVIIT